MILRRTLRSSPGFWNQTGEAGKSRGVVIGSRIDAKVGDTLSLFGTDVTVSARLDQSDTDCDTTVYMDPETLRSIADASGDETLKERIRGYDGNAASSILIDVKDGYDVESVKNDINIHIKKVRAVQSQHVLTHAASGMGGVSRGVKLLMAAVWAVCVGVMAAVLVFETRERRREFALLRIMGASGRKISGIVRGEVLSVSGIGALTGTLAGLILVLAGNGWMERWLSLPFLFPDAAQMAWNVLLSLLIPTVTGAAESAGRNPERSFGRKRKQGYGSHSTADQERIHTGRQSDQYFYGGRALRLFDSGRAGDNDSRQIRIREEHDAQPAGRHPASDGGKGFLRWRGSLRNEG